LTALSPHAAKGAELRRHKLTEDADYWFKPAATDLGVRYGEDRSTQIVHAAWGMVLENADLRNPVLAQQVKSFRQQIGRHEMWRRHYHAITESMTEIPGSTETQMHADIRGGSMTWNVYEVPRGDGAEIGPPRQTYWYVDTLHSLAVPVEGPTRPAAKI
jgi:hypothetical protein